LRNTFGKRPEYIENIVDLVTREEYSVPYSILSECEMVSNARQLPNEYPENIPPSNEKSLIGEKILSYSPYLSKSHAEELRYYWGYQKRENQLREKLGL